jgi:hypothetical protein
VVVSSPSEDDPQSLESTVLEEEAASSLDCWLVLREDAASSLASWLKEKGAPALPCCVVPGEEEAPALPCCMVPCEEDASSLDCTLDMKDETAPADSESDSVRGEEEDVGKDQSFAFPFSAQFVFLEHTFLNLCVLVRKSACSCEFKLARPIHIFRPLALISNNHS